MLHRRRLLLNPLYAMLLLSFIWPWFIPSQVVSIPSSSTTSSGSISASSKNNNNDNNHPEKTWWEGMALDNEIASTEKDSLKEYSINSAAVSFNQVPPLQIPCGVNIRVNDDKKGNNNIELSNTVHPLKTIIDTSLSKSIIYWDTLVEREKNVLSNLVVPNNDNKNSQGELSSFIPAGAVWLRMGSEEATVPGPSLWLANRSQSSSKPKENVSLQDDFDIRLGMDFLRQYKAIIDLEQDEMTILVTSMNNHDESKSRVMIPFLRPRMIPGSFSFHDDL